MLINYKIIEVNAPDGYDNIFAGKSIKIDVSIVNEVVSSANATVYNSDNTVNSELTNQVSVNIVNGEIVVQIKNPETKKTVDLALRKVIVKIDDKDVNSLNMITCHLGNGASITAIKGGKVVNTSMGLSPLGGIMMGTRCGDIDPTVVYYMEEKLGCSPEEMDTYLNKKSGMLGVSGISSDARDIQAAVDAGNPRAITTYNLYVNRAVNLIGGYYMQLGHVDAMSFTAGLGEHAVEIREGILKGLEEGMGVKIDYELNSKTHSEAKISLPDSKVEVFVVPTNEELVIARDTVRLLGL